MKATIGLLAAGAIAFSPALAAAPGGHGSAAGPKASIPTQTTTSTMAPGQGQTNGAGYNHMHTQAQANGQPNQDCEALGTTPGNAGSAPGGGSPFIGETSKAGSQYAGSAPQNSRNTASVSQYDVACANQKPH